MLKLHSHGVLLLLALTRATVSHNTRRACGAENVEEFTKALRSAGYYDMAVAYLNRVADRPDVDSKFKSRLPYELGTVLVESALATPDRVHRDKKLDQAQSKLREFVGTNPDAALAATANFQLAGVLLLRGQALVAHAQATEKDKVELRSEAHAPLRRGDFGIYGAGEEPS